MPPNLANTMFARWYGQQVANRAMQREEDAHQAEMLDRAQASSFKQRAEDRADMEAKAKVAGAQAEMLGEPAPQIEDPGMRVAATQGAQGSRIETILAARAAERAARLQRLKDMGALDKAALEKAADAERQQGINQTQLRVGGGHDAARIQAAEIAANRPLIGLETSRGKAADAALIALDKVQRIKGYATDQRTGKVDFAPFVSKGARMKNYLLSAGESAAPGLFEKLPEDMKADYRNFQQVDELLASTNTEEFHRLFGATGTAGEEARARQSIINNRMNPTRLALAMDDYERVLKKTIALAQGNAATRISLAGSAATMPQTQDAPVVQAETKGARVMVRTPEGQLGHIPADRLADFLKAHPDAQVVQ